MSTWFEQINAHTRFFSYLNRNWRRWAIFLGWGLVIWAYWGLTQNIAPTPLDKIEFLLQWFLLDGWGPFIFVVVYMVQPLVFFPTFLMTICGGLLYGPLWGLLYSYIGANAAASVCYGVGRLLGGEILSGITNNRRLERYVEWMRANTFEAILTLTLLYAPFDMMNYLSGILRLRWRQFASAIAIGVVPGGLPFVLFGSALGSVDEIFSGRPQIDFSRLLLSISIAVIAIFLSQYLKRRRQITQTDS
ncbi:VTT domain-containing protein [Chloroflexi bacterium TSY]|nr:VTT domain-containing protein [Chloroflexi bacterium TSY]